MHYFFYILIILLAQPLFSDASECVPIENNIERLECYDNFYQSNFNQDNLDQTPSATENLITTKEKALIIKEEELNKKEIELAQEQAKLTLKERELDSAQERRWFGFTKRVKEPDEEEITISSKIDTVATKLNYQLLIILENDQHWVSVEKFRRHKLKDGYDVEITKGFLSGFALRVPGKKIKIRVSRIK